MLTSEEHVWSSKLRVLAASVVLLLAFEGVHISQASTVSDTYNHTHSTAFLSPTPVTESVRSSNIGSKALVPEPSIVLDYHLGPVMTGRNNTLKLFVIYYGGFSDQQRSTLRLFFRSLRQQRASRKEPTVAKWWEITNLYVDLFNHPVASNVVLAGEAVDRYSLGKSIKQMDIQKLVLKFMRKKFGIDSRSIYIVLTSDDVQVERFCMNVCGTHFYTFPSDETNSQMVPYGWVGNPAQQCPGLCSWPYAPGGFLQQGLIPPNGDAGIDGMIITIGNLLAGIATDPFGNAYFQADGLEAAGVCQGIYGTGAFPGYPGELLVDKITNASFNVYGKRNSKFLLTHLWHPTTRQCAGQV
ncbi:hypothetical protein MPTK1_6g18770 [Marchantia polymorpha subsp. ruderalis]|nr:hypothetical protein MARPO_0038s0087 [Marchantia polymorpha]BBN15331.1 hypothetical protein Mp_6g18770 [Marchantia polymorpha subsp. ruderalis]|eukprot:PTQ40764.1 hypothetical protein MARPO_0038s0087 [Marchantia polymorpha]